MTLLARMRATALLICCLAAFQPASAQMDPRLQSSTTDLLDVYKVNSANPELLTIFDFSGSMHAVYWNANYYTDAKQSIHNANWFPSSMWAAYNYNVNMNTGDDSDLVPVLDANGNVYLAWGGGYYSTSGGLPTDNYGYGNIGWPINITNPVNTNSMTGVSFSPGQLIAPDGSVVTVSGSSLSALQTAVQQASHIRITATNGTVTRTIDLPIPWVVLDSTNTSTNNASGAKWTITDPVGGVTITPDVLCDPNPAVKSPGISTSSAASNLVNTPIYDYGTGKDYYKIGRFHYTADYLWWVFFGQTVRNSTDDGEVSNGGYVTPVSSTAPAWKNGLAGLTRYQALKQATITAWYANQKKVWWGIRFLDSAENNKAYVLAANGNAASPQVDRNINLLNQAASGQVNGAINALRAFAPRGSTPLTYAFANAYTQLALTSDSGSTFGTTKSSGNGQQSGTESPIKPCRKSFVIVFTDGIANDTYSGRSAIGSGDPYSAGSDSAGNTTIGAMPLTPLDPGNPDFNIPTLSAVAAHYAPPTGWAGPSGSPDGYYVDQVAPFNVTNRGATIKTPRAIRTMTVAMSVAGSQLDSGSGKSDLFRAALYGNPNAPTWDLNAKPYDPSKGNGDPLKNPFFFDATSVDKLNDAFKALLNEVTAGSAAIAAPASPLVGLSLGNQAYLGLFQTLKGPRWLGDLLMAGLYVGPQGVFFLDKNGFATPSITDKNAIWSAATSVFRGANGAAATRTWASRNLWTNKPGTNTLIPFDTSNITPSMLGLASTDTATRDAYVRFMRGANSTGETDPTNLNPRPDIMGDIVNSSPTVLEYPIDTLKAIGGKLAGHLSEVPSTSTPHFRIIFSGDNQGVFHAFGELSWNTTGTISFTTVTTDPTTGVQTLTVTGTTTGQIPHGYVDELWGFIPGEYLTAIGQLRDPNNPHRYMVDGNPTVYFKDVPASGQSRGDGLVDGNDVVRVIMGERKGGRSYYAFDFSSLQNAISNTGTVMPWSLVPDNYTNTGPQANTIRHMGYSTANPTIGRVDIGSATNQDLVFLGGGLSTYGVDKAFAADSSFNDSSAKMGRSILAFDIVQGPSKSLYTWDFSGSTALSNFGGGTMGCIPSGIVPTEFFAGSGHAQRVYFADAPTDPNTSTSSPRGGGVWALGSTMLAPNGVIRLDSSDITQWTSSTANTTQGIRHIFQAPSGWSITTTPTPFLLSGPYPGIRTSDPKTAPAAVGLSFGTGDRNDPMDNDGINPVTLSGSTVTPGNNWLNVVFDRQDSSSLSGVSGVTTVNLDATGISQGMTSSDGDVADLTSVSAFTGTFNGYSVDPTSSSFYLKQKLGYKLNVGYYLVTNADGTTTGKTPPAVAKDSTNKTFYFPKVITNTVVLNGVLFFSDFIPGAGTDACKGTGITDTYRICNILQPTYNFGDTQASSTSFNGGSANCSGVVLTYPNLPGEITALGTAAVIQSGQGSDKSGSIDNSGAMVGGSFGKLGGFGFKPRSWRIIR